MLRYFCDHCNDEILGDDDNVYVDVRGPYTHGPSIHLHLHVRCYSERYGDVFEV